MVTPLKKIAVFCGAKKGRLSLYTKMAHQLAKVLVEANITLVYGGAHVGLMGEMADEVLKLGGEVIGVLPQFLVDREVAHTRLTQLHVVASMHERKVLISELADGFIMLPGGAGSLDEFFEMLTLAQLGLHQKPCGILNVANYYDSLIYFLKHAIAEGFIQSAYQEMVIVEQDAKLLLQRFWQAPTLIHQQDCHSSELGDQMTMLKEIS